MPEKMKVLVVDDEADVRQFVQAVLEDDGYEFIFAEDGEAAVQAAREQKPDVVIMDVQMPKKNGFQAFYELRSDESTKSLPIIMLTAVAERTGIKFDSEDMGDYLGSEPDAYIDKPIEPEMLRETVKNILQGGSAD